MKKRMAVYLLMVVMVLGALSGCSKSKNKDNEDYTNKTTLSPVNEGETEGPSETKSGTEDEEETEAQKNEEDNNSNIAEPKFTYDGEPIDALPYQVPMENIVVDRPRYQVIDEGLTRVFNRGGSLFISFTSYYNDKSSDLKPEDAMEMISEDVLYTLHNYYNADDNYELIIDKTEDMTINGVDCKRFEGKVHITWDDGEDRDRYTVGYSFVKEDIPCLILGMVVENDQLETHIDEVRNNVDEMMKTIRDAE